jgi:hypothetical protein
MRCEGMKWMNLAQGIDKQKALVNVVNEPFNFIERCEFLY